MKETYCLEDTLYNTKRYFTMENGVVSGTELAQEDFLQSTCHGTRLL